jgi:hypothetical protein
MGRAGLEASFNFPSLPNRNAFGNCNFTMCHDKTDGWPIGFCDTDSCRKMETSETIIVLEPENGPGTLSLLNSSYFIREDIHFFVFPVKRVFGHQGSISVNYTCASYEIKNVSVAALEGQEFVPVQGILQWTHEDLSDKFVRVPIIHDTKYIKGWSKRSFRVTIHGVAGGALIDSKLSNATIIIDDASPGAVVFRYSRKSFLQSQTSGMIEIARVGGDDFSMEIMTTDSTVSPILATALGGSNRSQLSVLEEQTFICMDLQILLVLYLKDHFAWATIM